MAKNINQAVREVCLSFPEAEEIPSRGSPDFRVRNKTFATYVVNHHGDGRLALWLHSPKGAQDLYTTGEPDQYFVPPYVGPRGWLGVHLDQGNDWFTIATRVREAYANVAPRELTEHLGPTIDIEPPTETIDPEEFDPLVAPHAQEILAQMRALVATLPETSEGKQFGLPAWKAGKKTFATASRYRRTMTLQTWVGPELQSTLTDDPRFTIPNYIGHRGWIDLNVEEHADWEEIERLVLGSYRHFALKRMLKAMGEL